MQVFLSGLIYDKPIPRKPGFCYQSISGYARVKISRRRSGFGSAPIHKARKISNASASPAISHVHRADGRNAKSAKIGVLQPGKRVPQPSAITSHAPAPGRSLQPGKLGWNLSLKQQLNPSEGGVEKSAGKARQRVMPRHGEAEQRRQTVSPPRQRTGSGLTQMVSIIEAQNISQHEALQRIRSGQLLFQGLFRCE